VRCSAIVLLCLATSLRCFASDTVYLNSGFTLTVDSYTRVGDTYLLQLGIGTVQYPADQVREIVPLPDAQRAAVKQIPGTATLTTIPEPKQILSTAAKTEGVDELFVRSVAKVESGLRQEAISRKGALGLMQLMPGTASELGVDPKQAAQNASGGARYLRSLLERYNYNPVLALAAYNAGPAAVKKYGGLPPYYETRTYVVRVLKEYEKQLRLAGINPENVHAQALKTPIATN
jgi:soluble lytic murein transglycosylase-like protein